MVNGRAQIRWHVEVKVCERTPVYASGDNLHTTAGGKARTVGATIRHVNRKSWCKKLWLVHSQNLWHSVSSFHLWFQHGNCRGSFFIYDVQRLRISPSIQSESYKRFQTADLQFQLASHVYLEKLRSSALAILEIPLSNTFLSCNECGFFIPTLCFSVHWTMPNPRKTQVRWSRNP